jgi:RHS repeat-associated protein
MTSILRATTSGGASITTNFGYDNADRVTTITHSSSSAGALATYLYSFDAASQLTQYTGPEGILTYTYDLSSELTAAGDARTENYSYDLNGNRNSSGYTTASDNRLTADGTYTMAYDAEGNMTSKTRVSDGENWTYTWDDRNRLTDVVEKTGGGVTATHDVFTYDVENRRIGKSMNGTQSWYGYDGQNSYADFNGSGSLTMRYLTGKDLDELYARFDGTNTAWYLDDMLGSVRQIANTNGTVLDTLTYDSYGQMLSESNSSNGDRFKYTSREWDSEIGQQYNRARYYDPAVGRWTSADPSGLIAGLDLYAYVHNAPNERIDPIGLQDISWTGKNKESWFFTQPKNPDISDVIEIVDGPRFLYGLIWEHGWFTQKTPCGVCNSNPGFNVMSPVWEPGGRLRYFVWVNGQAKDADAQKKIQAGFKQNLKLNENMTAQQQIDAINNVLDQYKDQIDWKKGISTYNYPGGRRLPQSVTLTEGELNKKHPRER